MKIPTLDPLKCAFGAPSSAYPKMEDIPEEHRSMRSNGCEVFSKLFFSGGRLSDHGLKLKDDVDSDAFYFALRALMSSWEPKHEVKTATCGWLIETHTEPLEESAESPS